MTVVSSGSVAGTTRAAAPAVSLRSIAGSDSPEAPPSTGRPGTAAETTASASANTERRTLRARWGSAGTTVRGDPCRRASAAAHFRARMPAGDRSAQTTTVPATVEMPGGSQCPPVRPSAPGITLIRPNSLGCRGGRRVPAGP
jgi:hypothetical protein